MRCKWIGVELTKECNLRCKTCLFACTKKVKDELSTQEVLYLIDDFSEMGLEGVKFTGGEALLRKDIFEIIDYAKMKGLKVRLNSNCTRIDEEIISKLNADIVQVSLDGLEDTNDWVRGKGTFRKTIESISMFREKGICVEANIVIMKRNINEIVKLTDLLFKRGVSEVCYSRLVDTGRCKDIYADEKVSMDRMMAFKSRIVLYSKIKRHKISFDGGVAYYIKECGVKRWNPFITCTGDVTPCCAVRDFAILGNIRNKKYREIIENYDFESKTGLFGNCNDCIKKIEKI